MTSAESNDLLSDSGDRDDSQIGARFDHPAAIQRFCTGGKAVITLVGSENRYTFQVTKSDVDTKYPRPAYFVSMLIGPDNTADYSYVGLLDSETGRIRLTRKSKMNDDSQPVRAWNWFMGIVWSGRMPTRGEAWHVGRCGRCGRALTVPASIASGFGPECAAKLDGGGE